MSNLIKILLLAALGYGAYLYFAASPAETGNPLIGEWRSHEGKSMRQLQRGGLTQEQEYVFKSLLGRSLLTVTEDRWSEVTDDGESESGSYTITSLDGDCFNLDLSNDDTRRVCLVDGDMHIQTKFRGSSIVYVRAGS